MLMIHSACVVLAGVLTALNPIAFTSVHHGTQSLIEDSREVTV